MLDQPEGDTSHANVGDEALESVGIDSNAGEHAQDAAEAPAEGNQQAEEDGLPSGVKARLGRQEKRHQRELKQLQAQLAQMQSLLTGTQPNASQSGFINPDTGEPIAIGSEEEKIAKAVALALRQKELAEAQAKKAESVAHVQKQYQSLNQQLDKASDKYDDFDDVVRNEQAPFTDAMRDAALLLPNAADVLYKLGKNPDELKRIASLHPLDQARELVILSHALVAGKGGNDASQARPIGSIKSNPVTNPSSISEKTPVSELRKRMKTDWK